MEKKTAIRIPEAYVPLLEDIRLLTETRTIQTVLPLSNKSRFG
jgi:hypothetical protein